MNRSVSFAFTWSIALGLLAVNSVAAQTVKLSPTGAVIFKNGLSWVVEEGVGEPTDEGWISSELHAIPVIGSLNIQARGDVQILEIKSTPVDVDALSQALGKLKSGDPKSKMVVTAQGRNIEGVYVGISAGTLGLPLLGLMPGEETVLIPMAQIEKISIASLPGIQSKGGGSRTHPIKFRLSLGEAKRHVTLSYLAREIGWIPSYILTLLPGDKGLLRMEATVVNEAMAFASTQVQLATGESLFPFRHISFPALDASADPGNIMRTIMGRSPFDGSSNANAMNTFQAQQMVDGRDVAPTAQAGEESYLYGPFELTMARGDRVVLPVGDGEVPARQVFYWRPSDPMGGSAGKEDVWMAAAFSNDLGFPLTTGPILVLKNDRPLGQGVVPYTHKGGEVLVPISISSSVLCMEKLKETDRDKGKVEAFGQSYDSVTVSGSVEIRNLNKGDITIHIERPVIGKVKKSSDEADVDERFTASLLPNQSSTIRWRLVVPKGETRTVTFQYQTLVPSRDKGFLSF